ncbi:prephenate dehydrogenase [Halorarum halophilum]|uniref:Prephenate dehydrogenase n=1 Tax=Halorarum halophilum TaxID=2743090 RepID=A0A7D5GB38_9EURY|nr:prephenate dehydrogenase/arogenate dehydrogenase family protein [Halobaculum halophilum]QLG27072.1 prephenate dehydrogenase [Halobaculum halophilum]
MRLFVVGAGEMGRWLARTLRPAVDRVAFADTNPQVAMDAADEMVDGRVVPLDTDEAFDCVALAVPIPAVPEAVEAHAPNAATGALVDVSGAMTEPLAAMAEHAEAEYASFHPLFAPPRAPGRVAYVPGESGSVVERVRETMREADNDVFETTAAEHDEAMRTVQTGAHTAVLAYALAAEDVPKEFHTPVSEPLSELAGTVTAGDAAVYGDIREAFGGADAIAEAAAELAEADSDSFSELFAEARERVGSDPREGAGRRRGGGETEGSRSGDGE